MIKNISNRLLLPLLLVFLLVAQGTRTSAQSDRDDIERAYGPKRFALVIGINDFRDNRWRSLQFAEKDASDMAASLKAKDVAGFDLVIELIEPWQTTRAAIKEAFKHLYDKNMSTEDIVFIYFSTHGTLARDSEFKLRQYLVAYDTDFGNVPETAIDVADLLDDFNSLNSKRKVLIMASCHSGMGKSGLPPDIERELAELKTGFFVKPVEYASEASMVIGVCSWGETAREDNNLQNDIYTHFFLKGMKLYDRNQDGAVSVSEAHDFAQRNTYYYTNGTQRPFARSDILGTDPIILTGQVRQTGLPVVLSYSGQFDGAVISINGMEKGALPDGFTTSPGWNRIQAFSDKGDSIYDGLLYVRQGERLDMDRLIELRSEPRLGVVTSYRVTSFGGLSENVLPGMVMYGLAYRMGAFPTKNASVLVEAAYGRTQWSEDLENNYDTDFSLEAVEANAALLFSHRAARADIFGGPLVGVFGMVRDIDVPGDSDTRNAETIYPGLIGGVKLRMSPDMHIELSNRISYHYFNVGDKMEGTFVNEVSATVYFRPRTFLDMFQQRYRTQEVWK